MGVELELVPVVAVPGDPPVVRAAAEGYAGVADQIARAAAGLRALADQVSGDSRTVDQLRADARSVAEKVGRVEPRYRTVSTALSTYATGLDYAVQAGEDARVRALAARQDYEDAHTVRRYWVQEASALQPCTIGPDGTPGFDGEDVAHARGQVTRYGEQVDEALARFGRAMDDLRDARRQQAAAAASAAQTIAGVHDDGLDDTLWDDLSGVAHTVGQVLYTIYVEPVVSAAVWTWNHVETISGYLAVASLALGWIPIVGQVLDAVTLVVGLVAVVKAGIGVAEAYADHQDTGKAWEELGMAALGVATLGAGRITSKGLELAYDTAKAGKAAKSVEAVDTAAEAVAKTETAATKATEVAEDAAKATGDAAGTTGEAAAGAERSTDAATELEPRRSTVRELAGSLKFWEDFKGVKILTKWSTGNPVDALGNPEAIGDALAQGVRQFNPSTWTFSLTGIAKEYALTQAAGTKATQAWMTGIGADKIIDLALKGHDITNLTDNGSE